MSEQDKTIVAPAIVFQQPLGLFYVANMLASDLRHIARADVRRIEDRKIETYAGIQRPLNQHRVKEIREYIGRVDASFPNSIIVSVKKNRIRERDSRELAKSCREGAFVCLEIDREEDTAQIIDGQHRLAGFTPENGKNFDVIVTIFVELELEDQAYLFSVINLKQTKVNKSLVYDLFDLETTRSPQKTAHDVAKAVNQDSDSPFYHRIKILGVVPRTGGEKLYDPMLTQGTFVSQLLPLISRNPDEDRDRIKRNESIAKSENEIEEGLIFRGFFREDKDWAIVRIINNYFSAFCNEFPNHWNNRESPLGRTIGFAALMRLLPDLYRLGAAEKKASMEFFASYFSRAAKKAKEESIVFTFDSFPASGTGETALFKELRKLCGIGE